MKSEIVHQQKNILSAAIRLAANVFRAIGNLKIRNRKSTWWGRQIPPSETLQALDSSEINKRRRLVVDRPATLEQRYELIERDDLLDEVFRRLQRQVYTTLDRRTAGVQERLRGPAVLREAGRLAVSDRSGSADPRHGQARPYFYLKPQNRPGWLFERSGSGWTLSQAEKIVAQNLFLRQGPALDVVTLHLARDRLAYPRVRSALFGNDLLSFAVYEQKLMEHLHL